jgi:hypothetical protein
VSPACDGDAIKALGARRLESTKDPDAVFADSTPPAVVELAWLSFLSELRSQDARMQAATIVSVICPFKVSTSVCRLFASVNALAAGHIQDERRYAEEATGL